MRLGAGFKKVTKGEWRQIVKANNQWKGNG